MLVAQDPTVFVFAMLPIYLLTSISGIVLKNKMMIELYQDN